MPAALKRPKRSPFASYRAYVSDLKRLMNETNGKSDWDKRVDAALNGQASVELRLVAARKTRRKYGAYFTGTGLSERLLARCESINRQSIFYDASCGVGDLLLAAAKNLPLARTLQLTLMQWGRQLTGTDLHPEFIEGAKARLVLLARQRHQSTAPLIRPADNFFPYIQVGDGLAERVAFQRATTVLMNSPFGRVESPRGCNWASGRVSEAATFMITALERVQPATEVLAILPDVLRSGSFSEQWRDRVSELADVHMIELYGVFDESADVDVFLLRIVRRADKSTRRKPWPPPTTTGETTVADYFDVHVGRVVPYRDPRAGPEHAYIHPRCVPTWEVVREFTERRRHRGLAFQPPFVVLRRTSRPGDAYRATASVIAGKEPIAVENHLIVCEPKDKTVKSCRELMRQLRTEAVNEFLNERIRCRHLTVGAVANIPFDMS
jgi:hypothetical protein